MSEALRIKAPYELRRSIEIDLMAISRILLPIVDSSDWLVFPKHGTEIGELKTALGFLGIVVIDTISPEKMERVGTTRNSAVRINN